MKKNYFFIFVMAFLVSIGLQAQPKKIGYFTLDKAMAEGATTVDADPIIRLLKADPNFQVTVNKIPNRNFSYDLSGYDVIIIQESIGGNDTVLKPGRSLALDTFTVPVLYNKTYAFRATRAFATGAAGTGAEMAGVYKLKVDPAKQTHDIFKGITFNAADSTVTLLKVGANDLGAPSATKALNYATGVVLSNTTTLLGKPLGSPATATVCYNDIPAGTVIGSETLKARMITVGMNFGAMSRDYGTNLTPEALTIWRNAVYSLAGLTVPTTLAEFEKYKIGYFTLDKAMDASADSVEDDPIIRMLKNDVNGKFDVSVNAIPNRNFPYDLSGYDAIVIQESIGGNDTVLKPGRSLALDTFPVPVIYNKTYAFRATRAFATGAAGTGAETAGLNKIKFLDSAFVTNPLFRGITFGPDSSVALLKAGAADNGAHSATKTLNYATGVVLSDTTTLLAMPDGLTSALIPTVKISINDIPAGTTVGSEVLKSRMIAMGMNFGAICRDKGTNLTSAGFTLWRNAIYSALGISIPAAPVADAIPEIHIALITPATNGDEGQYKFLQENGMLVDRMYPGKLGVATDSIIDSLNKYDLIIIGRAGGSGDFGSGDAATKAEWNDSITVPIIENSAYHVRNNRLNWFNSATTAAYNGPAVRMGKIKNITDGIFANTTLTGDSAEWAYPVDDYLSTFKSFNGDTVAYTKINDTTISPLIVRFKVGSAFYPGSLDTVRAARTYFGMGNDAAGPRNYFPLTPDAQAAYFAEIFRMTGKTIMKPIYFASNDATLSSLAVSEGDLAPEFSSDVTAYSVAIPTDSVRVTGTPTVTGSTVATNGYFDVGTTASIRVTSTNGGVSKTYTVAINGDCSIEELTASQGTLVPEFDAEVTSYTISELPVGSTVTFEATPVAENAAVSGETGGAAGSTATITVIFGGDTCAYSVDLVTGINELTEAGICMFPNPVKSNLTIKGLKENTTVTILNSVGQQIFQTVANNDKLDVNVDSYNDGIYMVKFVIEGKVVHTRMFIKE